METTIKVTGMTCGGCVASVKRVLEQTPGVTSADVSLADGLARVSHDPGVQAGTLRNAVEEAGFETA
jgi:copper chaperone